jgi:predicted component of type VI protein secretion system
LNVSDLIFVEQKPMEGREQTLEAGATIGREGCDVNLMDPEVSRRHAAIRSESGSLAIEDLGSTNGTFVNGERITTVTVLRAGDSVRLGNTVWSLRSTASAGNGGGVGATTVGQVPDAAGGAEVTAARSAPPAAPDPPTAQQVPAGVGASASAAPPAPSAPPAAEQARPAAPSARQAGRRGDVDAPPEVAPSAIRRVLPPPAPGQAPQFSPPGPRPGGSAATRVEATVVCMIIVALVAAALVIYFVTY